MSISLLPSELLPIILSFYAQDFREIIHFTSVCKEWKEIGDHSEMWLMVELSFYCPTRYFLLYYDRDFLSHGMNNGNYDEELVVLKEKIRIADGVTVITDLSSSDPSPLPSRVYKVITSQDSILNTLKPCYNDSSFHVKREIHSIIREKFLTLRRQYYIQWEWYCTWIPWIDYFTLSYHRLARKEIFYIALMINWCCKIGAYFLLSDIVNHSTSLTSLNHLGFVILLLNELLYVLAGVVEICERVGNSIKFSPFLNQINLNYLSLLPSSILISAVIGIIASIIFLQIKLSNRLADVLYSLITIPLWIFLLISICLATLYFLKAERSTEERQFDRYFLILVLSIICIPLGFTLFAIHQDNQKLVEVVSGLSPFFLAENTLFCYAWGALSDLIDETKIVCSYDVRSYFSFLFSSASIPSLSSSQLLKFFLVLMKCLFIITSFVLAVIFNAFVIAHVYSLRLGIVFGIFWFMSFESALLLQALLHFHFV